MKEFKRIYLEKGYTSFAVDEYLTAIRLMPVRDEFLAMIYDNLADCYEKDDLYDTSNPQLSSSASFLRLNVLSSLN